MITLKPGKEEKFWVGMKGKCIWCGGKYRLEVGDDPLVLCKTVVSKPCATKGCCHFVEFRHKEK